MTECYVENYPRPQFVRGQWTDLNGQWDFAFDDADRGDPERWYEDFPSPALSIRVPFTFETELSGIHDEALHPCVWYHRILPVDANALGDDRLILHFEGSDFYTRVWVNGRCAGSHRGGYARFSFDITDLVHDGENSLTVQVRDDPDVGQPRGKQRWLGENYGCWYVQLTGIWKTVWTEQVPKARLEKAKMTPLFDRNELKIELTAAAPPQYFGPELSAEVEVRFEGTLLGRVCVSMLTPYQTVTVDMNMYGKGVPGFAWDMKTWSPAEPNLYDVDLRLRYRGEVIDKVGSYCAMREIRIDGPNILLNGEPLYQRLILDQGYWKKSGLTPPDEAALIRDIESIQALGFNGVRKHQKIEDERFLYWCDVKGLLVWSEAPAAYVFTEQAVREFISEWMEIVEQNYDHPCIITWTPFNESWGAGRVKTRRDQQHFTEAVYHLTKSLDPYRPVIVNDGWEHTVSDILTLHDYEEKGQVLKDRYVGRKEGILAGTVYHNGFKAALADGFAYRGQPVMISEFGGIAFKDSGEGWGYGTMAASEEEFLERLKGIAAAVREIPYVCGYCYTQVTDVQQEINGLMDMDRNFKVAPEKIRDIIL